MYGILNWGSAKLHLLNKINKLLYKCGSILTFSNKNDGKKKLNELKLLNINQLYILESCKLILQFQQNQIPSNLKPLFNFSKTTHNYGTRQSSLDGLHCTQHDHKFNSSFISYSVYL